VSTNPPPEHRPGPPGGKRALNRERRIREISDAALVLFLEAGIEAVTIDAICEHASIAKGSFYRYFEDKAALVRHLMAQLSEPLVRALDAGDEALRSARDASALEAAYRALALQIAAALFEHVDVVRLYLAELRGAPVASREPVTALAELVRERAIASTVAARSHGLLRATDVRITTLVVIGAVESLLHEALSGRLLVDPSAATNDLLTIVLDGVRARG
jgi:AcrR family transcriptional regulator